MVRCKRLFGLASAGAVAMLVANMSMAAPVPPAPASAGLQSPGGDVRLFPSVKVPMRDGVHLATDIYLPKGPGPFPIILIRTPYDKNPHRPAWVAQRADQPAVRSSEQPVDVFTAAGYAVVIQDLRGKFESEGIYKYTKWERRDYEDTAKWLDAQPWSARRMGMWGCSNVGHTQSVAAVTGTPSLKTVTPGNIVGGANAGRYPGFMAYWGGAREYFAMFSWFASAHNSSVFAKPDPAIDPVTWARFAHLYNLGNEAKFDAEKLAWELPLLGILDRAGLPPTEYNTFVSNLPESRYWYDDNEDINEGDKFFTPALYISNWNDIGPGEVIDSFHWRKKNAANTTASDNQYLIMGPGPHCYTMGNRGTENAKVDDVDLADTRLPIWDILVKWNNRWVKGDVHAIDGMPKVTYWLYGKNEWRTSTDMPVPGTRYQAMYLSSRNGANSLEGDGRLSFDRPRTSFRDAYTYDPANPVLTGEQKNWGVSLADQRSIEARKDVLVYTSEPLRKGLTVVGPIKMVLHVSSSAVDTDFTGKLVDVYPDGRAIQLQNGILRARYRNSFLKPEMMTPGKTYEITVELNATANWFAPGHRIRLEVSSSNFPRFDRNLNTGGDGFTETKGVVAQNAILSGPSTPSRLILPVAPN